MNLSKKRYTAAVFGIIALLVLIGAAAVLTSKKEEVRLLYATNGDQFDTAAFGQFQQSLAANLKVERKPIGTLSDRQLGAYDAVVPDTGLANIPDKGHLKKLQDYVENGGHLLLDNSFASMFPSDFLGAYQTKLIAPQTKPKFEYPAVGTNVQGLQEVMKLFSDNFFKRESMDSMPGFYWGYGLDPSTAEPLVMLDGQAIVARNKYGKGTVLLTSTFLPNRYFITGYDLTSGMDPKQGFGSLVTQYNKNRQLDPGTTYFDKKDLKLEPYFHFAFSSAGAQLRTEFVSYVSKEIYGYSATKILGPYGRPAMAYQNHFEAMPAFQNKEGIQWAELTKKYNQIPSYSLVRSAFYWGQWKESATVQLNEGTNEKPAFSGEKPASYYSSGMHLQAEGGPVRLAEYPDYRSLADALDKPHRLVPAFADLNGDGRDDLLAGSSDGYIYVYPNLGQKPEMYERDSAPAGLKLPDAYGKPEKLLLDGGQPLQTGPHASVHAADWNADGQVDLIVSDSTGAVRIALGQGSGRFAPLTALQDPAGPIRVPGPAAAAVGDVDGDGTADLLVGDADGKVWLYRAPQAGALRLSAPAELLSVGAKYAAPSVRDMDGDGRADLVVGSNEGDLRVFRQESGGTWTDQGTVNGTTLNQMGTNALVGGHNSVPVWHDVNGDGVIDLVVGQLEFGSPIPLDSPDFPYKEQLQEFLQYTKDNHLELYPHVFVHNFFSDDQEKKELALHKQAFEKLGIPWVMPGTNQHTWRINFPDRLQTLSNERDQDIWFNFGFTPSHTPTEPRLGTDYIWGLPFLLEDVDGSRSEKPMLIYTPAPVLRKEGANSTTDIYDSYVKRDMPIDYFEHIEYHFPDRAGDLETFASYLDEIRTQHDYNFMTEPQMARSFLATLTTRITVSRSWADYVIDNVKDRLSDKGLHLSLRLGADTSKVPKQAAEYTNTSGVVIEKGEKYAPYSLTTDALVYTEQKGKLYLGLGKDAELHIGKGAEQAHIVRSNVPFALDAGQTGNWKLELQAAGMQQIKIYSPQGLSIPGNPKDVEIRHDEKTSTYTITRYGDKTSLSISLGNPQ
ncbi:FG-GAP repeat domain-containing protein [Paenibacillus lutrae]|uniref:VCBS repeat-containing protein n=1 Tax=Paenibacillus lutrae TaxID=2078573 RepID=A0A7X3FL24_9BACL|nr:VCBS repeat-containing protein [Paenibacillus lutrae]MVP01587.1 VCBS repeat-containing protein [Paenibacillus lutrae]